VLYHSSVGFHRLGLGKLQVLFAYRMCTGELTGPAGKLAQSIDSSPLLQNTNPWDILNTLRPLKAKVRIKLVEARSYIFRNIAGITNEVGRYFRGHEPPACRTQWNPLPQPRLSGLYIPQQHDFLTPPRILVRCLNYPMQGVCVGPSARASKMLAVQLKSALTAFGGKEGSGLPR